MVANVLLSSKTAGRLASTIETVPLEHAADASFAGRPRFP